MNTNFFFIKFQNYFTSETNLKVLNHLSKFCEVIFYEVNLKAFSLKLISESFCEIEQVRKVY